MIRPARVLASVSDILRLFSVALALPIPVALAYERWDSPVAGGIALPSSAMVFAASLLLCCAVWVPIRVLTRRAAHEDLLDRESYLTVAVSWLVVTAFAMLPLLLSNLVATPIDAFFEAMSGLTGTGSTTVPAATLAHAPPSILFWRAFTQWLGGLGIIVLTVALLSKLTHGGLQLFRGEAGSSTATRIKPKLAEVARGLWRMYAVITLVFVALLTWVLHQRLHLGFGDAFLEGTMATFSAYGNGAFATPGIQAVEGDSWVRLLLVVMMVAGATNFTLTFLLVRRAQARPLTTNQEWRFFASWAAAAAALVTAILLLRGYPGTQAVQDGPFTAISLATGTGLGAHPAADWPAAAVLALLLLVLVGGTAGSAAGGIKAFRALVLVRLVSRELRQLLHPRAVIPLRVGTRIVPEGAVMAVIAFLFTYLGLWVIGSFLLLVLEPSLGVLEATSASLGALGNVGVGFGSLADTGFSPLTAASKLVLVLLMWLGRLELFAALLVFTPRSWRT